MPDAEEYDPLWIHSPKDMTSQVMDYSGFFGFGFGFFDHGYSRRSSAGIQGFIDILGRFISLSPAASLQVPTRINSRTQFSYSYCRFGGVSVYVCQALAPYSIPYYSVTPHPGRRGWSRSFNGFFLLFQVGHKSMGPSGGRDPTRNQQHHHQGVDLTLAARKTYN